MSLSPSSRGLVSDDSATARPVDGVSATAPASETFTATWSARATAPTGCSIPAASTIATAAGASKSSANIPAAWAEAATAAVRPVRGHSRARLLAVSCQARWASESAKSMAGL